MTSRVSEQPLRICYMGITKPGFSRAGVHIGALRSQGIIVHECFDEAPGWKKFWNLYKKHKALQGDYDVLVVGYPGAIVVPFAKLIASKPVIFDAAWSLYEGIVLARGHHAHNPLGRFVVWSIDRLGHLFADRVLLDTDEQLSFYAKLMRVSHKKLRRLYTGCNEKSFYADTTVPKRSRFTAVFRGKYNIEAGLPTVLEAGRLLESKGIDLLIYSPGYEPKGDVPRTVTIIKDFFSLDELRSRMSECHVSIGQMERHERLHHTIPHKAFESLVMRIPYVAAHSRALAELMGPGKGLFISPASPQELCDAVVRVRDDENLRNRLIEEGAHVYEEKSSWRVLANELIGFIKELQAQ